MRTNTTPLPFVSVWSMPDCSPGARLTLAIPPCRPHEAIAARMLTAIDDARRLAAGHEAAIVSHQLPIWTSRSKLAGKRLGHEARRRDCILASLTSLAFAGEELASVTYSEPAVALLARASKSVGA